MRAPTRLAILLAAVCGTLRLPAQEPARVLRNDPADAFGGPLAADRGAAGLRQRLLELRTIASVMQVTAHPDDEQAGLLTALARGSGTRVSLLTLNRGEAGANAVGAELFDALGLLRTSELRLAGQYYGLDDQYFTSAVDYGYSKTMAEAARSWDTTAVLADMVRIIRRDQPLVVIGRWWGGARDGHGHHQLAGALTPLAVAAAADPNRFPEQLTREGLHPWRVQRLLRGNVRAGERSDLTIEAGQPDPWLGTSYAAFAADGYARQRSQTAGRRSAADGPAPQRLQQVFGPTVSDSTDASSGLDTALPATFRTVGEREPPGARAPLQAADAASRTALASLDPNAPWRIIPALVNGRRAIRAALARTTRDTPRAAHLLAAKLLQYDRALVAAAGVEVVAVAGPSSGDGHPGVPGDTVPVNLVVAQAAPGSSVVARVELRLPASWGAGPAQAPGARIARLAPWRGTLSVAIPGRAEPSRPPFARPSIAENHYTWVDGTPFHAPSDTPPLVARVSLVIGGDTIPVVRTVRIRQANEPEGVDLPAFTIRPPVSLKVLPAVRVVTDTGTVRVPVQVEVTGAAGRAVDATVGLTVGGRETAPASVRVARGERASAQFTVTLSRVVDSLTVQAWARVDGREWRDEVMDIAHRELEPAALYSTPVARIRRGQVQFAPGLRVGYVMGVGDLVPDAIAQLGATVTLLDAAAVSRGDYSAFDALVIGTRAYAVRPELAAATGALTAWARSGGNVVVLYQTQEFKPETMAPFRAALPPDAEEVTEQDAAVQLLAPQHPLLNAPNRITAADFDGWIEQRGSKFLTQLAPEYTALVETHDTGQAPQQGIWVTAPVGQGRWTYCALALHRQVPYGVPGAFRILANLLARPTVAAPR